MGKIRVDERRSRRFEKSGIRLIGLCALGGLVLGSTASAGPSAPQAPAAHATVAAQFVAVAKPKPKPAPARTLRGIGLKRWGAPYSSATGYDRYAYVLVPREDARVAARLPGTSIVYMSGTTIHKPWSTGVSYGEAAANGWLLKSDTGADLMNVIYRGYVADVGNRDYQQRFVNNVAAFMRSTKVDGVFIDDIIGHPSALTHGAFPAKYPTPEAWQAAMVSFVQTVGPALKSQGFYVIASASNFVPGDLRSNTSENTADFWRRIAPYVSGLMNEYWLQNPNDVNQLRADGSLWYQNWSSWQSLMSIAQDAGRDFFALSYGSARNAQAMRYLRASFLLDWNGRGGALIYSTTDTADPYHPIWVRQLGAPVKPKFERAAGVWQRRYEKGIVVVNSTGSPLSIRVNGKPWAIGPTDAIMIAAPTIKKSS